MLSRVSEGCSRSDGDHDVSGEFREVRDAMLAVEGRRGLHRLVCGCEEGGVMSILELFRRRLGVLGEAGIDGIILIAPHKQLRSSGLKRYEKPDFYFWSKLCRESHGRRLTRIGRNKRVV